MCHASSPIKNIEDIEKIKKYLLKNRKIQYYIIFVIGIETGLSSKNIFTLKVNNIKCHYLFFNEQRFFLDGNFYNYILKYIDSQMLKPEDFLFNIKSHSLNEYLNKIIKELNLNIKHIGVNTMRKTFGYNVYKKTNDINLLKKIFNSYNIDFIKKYIEVE